MARFFRVLTEFLGISLLLFGGVWWRLRRIAGDFFALGVWLAI